MSLPPYSFKHLMSIISSSKIATLFKFVSTVLFHRSSAILDFMKVTADYSFPDFRSPFPVPRSPFPISVTSEAVSPKAVHSISQQKKNTFSLFFVGEEALVGIY